MLLAKPPKDWLASQMNQHINAVKKVRRWVNGVPETRKMGVGVCCMFGSGGEMRGFAYKWNDRVAECGQLCCQGAAHKARRSGDRVVSGLVDGLVRASDDENARSW